MEVRVETLEELKRIRFSQFDKVFCTAKEREYYLVNDAGLTPDDEDIVQAAHGASYRWVAQKARNSGGGGGGEANTGANVGTGIGVFRDKTGATLNFKSLVAGPNVTLTPNADEIEISALGGGGGSAYPDTLSIITTPTTLTPAHQGIVFCTGIKVTLPASAPNGTTYKLIGSPGDVIIDTNGAQILGVGAGTDVKPGDPVITLVALNVPNLVWGVANKQSGYNYQPDRTYVFGDIVTSAGARYLSLIDNNLNQPLSDPTRWLALDGRVGTGTIALSDMLFTGTTPPTSGGGIYQISQMSSQAVVLDIVLDFPGAGSAITETAIGLVKASEIRDAITGILGGGDEDLFGTGHVAHSGGFWSAIPVTAIYSPTNLEYIIAKHAAINVAQARMQFIIRRS